MKNNYSQEFKDELLPNEELIWTERVKEPLNFSKNGKTYIFIGGLLLFLISGEKGVVGVVVGVILLVSISLYIRESRKNIYYALTNNRIIIKNSSSKMKIDSINIKMLKKVKMEKDGYGLGTIILAKSDDHSLSQVVLTRLESIKNIEFVYEEIMKVERTG